LINPHITDLLQAIANWRDELELKIDDAEHTVPPLPFKLLRAEITAFKRVCQALADSIPYPNKKRQP
jgi:hypothetical protein